MNLQRKSLNQYQHPKLTAFEAQIYNYEPRQESKLTMKDKLYLLKQEQEQRNQQLEQLIFLKEQRCFHNKQEILYHKLTNIEQNLMKWHQKRKNIELYQSLQAQYQISQNKIPFQYNQTNNFRKTNFHQNQRRNKSFWDFEKDLRVTAKPSKCVFNIKYQQQIDHMEKQVQLMNKKTKYNLKEMNSNSFQILVQDQSDQ